MPDINGSVDGKVAFVTARPAASAAPPHWRSLAKAPTSWSPTSTNKATRTPPA